MKFDSQRAADIAAAASQAHAAFTKNPADARHIDELFRLISRISALLAQAESDQGSTHRT